MRHPDFTLVQSDAVEGGHCPIAGSYIVFEGQRSLSAEWVHAGQRFEVWTLAGRRYGVPRGPAADSAGLTGLSAAALG
jgi:hypothetical protein